MSEDEILVLDVPFETVGISGVWDLTMLGPERRDIEYRYMLTDSRRFTRNHLHDIFVKRPNGTWCQLWQRRPNHLADVPARVLPDDHVLIVRTAVLDELIQRTPARQKQEPKCEQPTPLNAVDAVASTGLTPEPFDIAAQDLETAKGRREAVDAFLACANRTQPVVIRRKHIWLAIGHRKGRGFEHWQAMCSKTTGEADRSIRRILAMPIPDFIDQLRRQGRLTDK